MGSPGPERSPSDRRLVLMDLDGVIAFDGRVPAEARRLLERLEECGFDLRYLTNDGFNSRASRRRELLASGLDIPIDQLYTASYLAARFVREQELEPVLTLCGPPAIEEFADLRCVEPGSQEARRARSVLVGDYFQHYDFAVLKHAFASLEAGAELLAIHRKPTWPTEGRREIDVGFWVAGLEYCAKRSARLVGKPDPFSYLTVLEDAGCAIEHAIMVSDEEVPDLEGARRLGIPAVRFDGSRGDPYEALLRALVGTA